MTSSPQVLLGSSKVTLVTYTRTLLECARLKMSYSSGDRARIKQMLTDVEISGVYELAADARLLRMSLDARASPGAPSGVGT